MMLLWLRNDLRLVDNPALFYACEARQGVVAVVTLTPGQWREHDESPLRMSLWRDRLREVAGALGELNIPLKVLRLDRFGDVAPALCDLAAELRATELYFNYEYPLNERQRDREVCRMLESTGVSCRGYHGELIIPPGQVLTGQGTPFKVFTPFSRRWRQQLMTRDVQPLGLPSGQPVSSVNSDSIPDDYDPGYDPGYEVAEYSRDLWPAGEAAISSRLQSFIAEQVLDYREQRDFPSVEGTSRISPYLTIGALSPRQCLNGLIAGSANDGWLDSTWLNELVWREFYRHLLVAFPGQSRLEPFRPEVEARISWQHQDEAFAAWCRGETGYPLVDAAMKQLLHTGWMHNRLRMLVASFLTKLLRVDWRRGAAFFMQHLIDGDFASNLGGWQWCASVGADAAPYFRIFNPQRQSERFDPDAAFIKNWLPELASLPAAKCHLPGAGHSLGRPAPIVDYRSARQSALDDYAAHN
ncbi:deoxyribodipyrimidine photo-lyase [Nitrincola sp. MINF-07-Sa-05]|uniref:deoxyribodipyrimidine photo-lyase n=1 Tax=Nitrincola salilacus TaxID=3400273 RepID=UPI0039181F41